MWCENDEPPRLETVHTPHRQLPCLPSDASSHTARGRHPARCTGYPENRERVPPAGRQESETHLSSHSSANSSDGFSMRCSANEQTTISMMFASRLAAVLMLLFDGECPRSEPSGDGDSGGLFGFGAPTGLDAISGSLPSAMSRKVSGCA